MTKFEVRVRDDPGGIWITPVGILDLAGCETFDHHVWEAQATGRRVVLDLRALNFVDSAGIRSLVASRLRAIEWCHRLEIICGPGQARRVITLSGHQELLQIVEPTSSDPS